MEIKYSPLSPFVRKVMVVAHEVGVADRIRRTAVSVRDEPQSIVPFNPLGKIPVLVTDDGSTIYDSAVICEYLDATFGGGRLVPAERPQRWEVLTRAALADGMADAAILVRLERLRAPERQSETWLATQMGKVLAALDHLERTVPAADKRFDMGDIAVICALDYMALRLPELAGYPSWPKLDAYTKRMAERPSFQATLLAL
ncbi:MAG TPA: glutathione S-transferase family protein [Casimicrobiaceae bacterium]|nr:glutathione S-transferase family protein [Casimicrobiaceae bacterium]